MIHPSATDLAQRLSEQLTAKLSDLVGKDVQPDSATSRVMDNLVSTVSRLQVENELLQEELQRIKTAQHISPGEEEEEVVHDGTVPHRGNDPVKFAILYRVRCECMHEGQPTRFYLDPPRLFKGDNENCHFRGTVQISDDGEYLKDHPHFAFAVVKEFKCHKGYVHYALTQEGQVGPRGLVLRQDYYPREAEESEILVGKATQGGIKAILEAFPSRFPGFQNPPEFFRWENPDSMEDRFEKMSKPYSFFHLFGKTLIKALGEVEMDDFIRESFLALCQWMEDNYREEWDEAEALFAQGKVNTKHLEALFQPGELIFCSGGNGPERGAMVPWFPDVDHPHGHRFFFFDFNGQLIRHWRASKIPSPSWGLHQYDKLVDITSLLSYPLRFAPEDIRAKLVARGQRFWACRRQKLVCYNECGPDSVFQVCLYPIPSECFPNVEQAERRFMIDYDMYRRLHPHNNIFQGLPNLFWSRDEILESEEPPEEFLYCLPPVIHGFDFTTKTWSQYFRGRSNVMALADWAIGTLQVDRITDVTWNKKAFSQLVAPPETKELIQAVVSAHGERKNMGLDIIEGKGQGLLVLLHGGPGTGKTLTAESIAEEQERPLYRVTCGDIGTEPKEVEQVTLSPSPGPAHLLTWSSILVMFSR